ncbi:hypothetical protein T10_3790 [Trichinella papuae]|uniref:Uncharacterized protein n=1 Tax=Trichinella papuae TaxID=268474 RepID=A0A0V1ML72_9BILA|nr:hypothetical protein T10_3790 [Trichinella papuae]
MGHTAGTIWYKTQFRNISHRRIRKRTEKENFLLSLACTAVIDRKDHVETCRVDEHLTYKMEKKALLKNRSAEEMKPLPTIYDEEASAASAESSTSGQFPVYKRVRATTQRSLGKTFYCGKVNRNICWYLRRSVPQWYQQLFTIYFFVAGNLVPESVVYVQILKRPDTCDLGLLPEYNCTGLLFPLLPGATAFLPVLQVHTGVILLEAGIRDTLSVFIPIFLAGVGWHNQLNKRASKSHVGLYELLQLLIAEHGVMDTMIQHVLSENATVVDLRRINMVYAKKQQRVAQYTGEYTNGRRTLEQFLEALMYIKPEAI